MAEEKKSLLETLKEKKSLTRKIDIDMAFNNEHCSCQCACDCICICDCDDCGAYNKLTEKNDWKYS